MYLYNLPRNDNDNDDDVNPWKWPKKGLPNAEPPRGVPITPWPEEETNDDDDEDDDEDNQKR
jgi:hypothetical protein